MMAAASVFGAHTDGGAIDHIKTPRLRDGPLCRSLSAAWIAA